MIMWLQLEMGLRKLIARLYKTKRWSGLPWEKAESVFEHSYKQAIIVQLMIGMERDMGNPFKLDFYGLLQCAINHDWGEIETGDKPDPEKTEADNKAEGEAYARIVGNLIPGPLQRYFPQPIDRDPTESSNQRKFWRATELVGYLLYMLEQMKTYPVQYSPNVQRDMDLLSGYRMFTSVNKIYVLFQRRYEELKPGSASKE